MNSYSTREKLFDLLAADGVLLHTGLYYFFALRVRSHDPIQLIFSVSSVLKVVGCPDGVPSGMHKNNELEVGNPLHHLLV